MGKRIAILGFYHETNTFAAGETQLSGFKAYQYVSGADFLASHVGTGAETGGMIAAASEHGFDLVPLVFAAAVPSGLISRECFQELVNEILTGLKCAGKIDGILAVLHGAASARDAPDADGALLYALRKSVGHQCPIIATTDFHANISTRMADNADAIIGYDTYPHRDMAERGAEAVRLMADMLNGRKWHKALRKLPLLTSPQCQSTDDEPMRSILARLRVIEARDGVVTATVAMGFPYADTPDLGAAVLVHAVRQDIADGAADELAALLWDQRARFVPELLAPDCIANILADDPEKPIILVDPADNVGGGSSGDGTVVLEKLLEAGANDAVVVICDPAAAKAAARAGVDGTFDRMVGGHSDRMHGDPIRIRGVVAFSGPAKFRHSGSYMTGLISNMGLTAVVRSEGIQVVFSSLRTMPFDIEQLRSVGIEPSQMDIIVVKSAIAWRAAYGQLAGSVFTIDTPGICPSNLERLTYRNRPVPMYPLERDAAFANGAQSR